MDVDTLIEVSYISDLNHIGCPRTKDTKLCTDGLLNSSSNAEEQNVQCLFIIYRTHTK